MLHEGEELAGQDLPEFLTENIMRKSKMCIDKVTKFGRSLLRRMDILKRVLFTEIRRYKK